MGQSNAKPGRPRDPQADGAILAAARDLLAEGGLAGLTVEGTAQRAGVAKTTVYRRYPTKLKLAVSAVAALISPAPDADSVDGQIRQSFESFEGHWSAPGAQAAFLAVAAAAASDPEAHDLFNRTVIGKLRDYTVSILDEAQSRGQASPDADPDYILDVLMGALVHRAIIRQEPPDEQFRQRFTELAKLLYRNQPNAD